MIIHSYRIILVKLTVVRGIKPIGARCFHVNTASVITTHQGVDNFSDVRTVVHIDNDVEIGEGCCNI